MNGEPETSQSMKRRVGVYEIHRELGRGAMATVYEAEHTGLGKRVALKWMHAAHARKATVIARFGREGRTTARLRHPHVVDVTDVGEEDGLPFLVMELVQGTTLAGLLETSAALPLREVAAILLPIVSAVAHAHDANVVHRDLKPSNILIVVDGNGDPWPKVADFGVSKVSDEDALTLDGGLVGTIAYMAPEQLDDAKKAVPESDQYALGVILYQMVTGVLPFREETPIALMQAIVRGAPEPPSLHVAGLPAGFDAVVLRALASDPARRYASVRELGAALLPFASGRAWGAFNRELLPGGGASESTQDDEPRDASSAFEQARRAHPQAKNGDEGRARRFRDAAIALVLMAASAAVTFALGEDNAAYRIGKPGESSVSYTHVTKALAPTSDAFAADDSVASAAPSDRPSFSPDSRASSHFVSRRGQPRARPSSSLPSALEDTDAPILE